MGKEDKRFESFKRINYCVSWFYFKFDYDLWWRVTAVLIPKTYCHGTFLEALIRLLVQRMYLEHHVFGIPDIYIGLKALDLRISCRLSIYGWKIWTQTCNIRCWPDSFGPHSFEDQRSLVPMGRLWHRSQAWSNWLLQPIFCSSRYIQRLSSNSLQTCCFRSCFMAVRSGQ